MVSIRDFSSNPNDHLDPKARGELRKKNLRDQKQIAICANNASNDRYGDGSWAWPKIEQPRWGE